MCIILGVGQIRLEEGWVGVASVVWATFISLYGICQNTYVAWGKREEEERLTGREEPHRPAKHRIAVVPQIILVGILSLITILLTATLILRARDASLPPPGRKYYVNDKTYQVHLACVGNTTDTKTPTILLEAGEFPVENSLQPFINSLYQSGSIPRYCYWDRPGIGWSDNAPSPHSAGMSADTLSEALNQAGETGPWILVSAGVGSITTRIFTTRHILSIHGLVLIDPMPESFLSNLANPTRGFLLWLRGIVSPLGVDRVLGAIFKSRTREDRIFGISSYQSSKFLKAKLQENLVAGSMTASEIRSASQVPMPDTPLVVVSSGVEMRNENWEKGQKDVAGITKKLQAWDVVDGPHEVWRVDEGRKALGRRLGEILEG
ncbi:integral membrane protein [Aspergillus sclerotialis]|uniref:Integral membrane protein n=1 Tax=Aspergillus sclerotialis TaxID=2070753 RepID=A0A3A2ZF91_9EURO|nr:integral membrane protein [Aspergillus sclerotialis]